MNITFRPWVAWPETPTPPSERRSRQTYRQGWSDTLARLRYELERIQARDVVVQLDLAERQIRNDGWPRADATPRSPGVIVSCEIPSVGRVRYAVDSCEVWHHNARAIALGLEALRAVDRSGISRRREQYAGWKALPASTSTTLTAEEAAALLVRESGTSVSAEHLLASIDSVRHALRTARARAHPDAGGSADRFARVQEAWQVLAAHHRVLQP